MVNLQQMIQEDFDHYLGFMIPSYAQEKVKSGTWNAEEAFEKAEKEILDLIPQGLDTENHHLYSLVESDRGEKIGCIWIQLFNKPDRKIAYICDFLIFEENQGQGYGKQAMQALYAEVQRLGVNKISLHVFAHNKRAIELYKKMGFEFTNHYMAKIL